MGRSVQQALPAMEVQRVDRRERTVRKLDRLDDVTLRTAKARMGACVREAIGPRAFKEFGDESFVGKVCTGEKVPDYLARIVDDDRARRRLGLALLDDATVTVSLPPLPKKETKS